MEYIVNTPCGPVQGVPGRVAGTVAFKGIRYATAGRWEYPQEVTAWEGTYDASHYGHCSYQPRAFYDEELNEKKYFYYNEFRKGETYTYSEDCLFLNIFVPENAKEGDKLPVLFYIHGGGFTGGCGHEKHFDGPVWPSHGVIGVTINYRLGPMGLLCLPELAAEAGHTGNYGLYDQMTAMQWVQHNIASFGGDPENVTIMGQSAGGMSVQLHVESPLTRGLFHKAVMSSGCGMGTMMMNTPEKSGAFWKVVMERCGCETLEQFRNLPVEDLFAAWNKYKKEIKGGGMAVTPVRDELFVTKTPDVKDIPFLAGSTSHDMAPPVLQGITKKWVGEKKTPGYVWYFRRMLPGDNNGAWHSSDLWYWFGTLENCWRPMEETDKTVSSQMARYLCRFAQTGDPNLPGVLPQWHPLSKGQDKVLCLGEGETQMGKPKLGKMILTMLTNKAVGE